MLWKADEYEPFINIMFRLDEDNKITELYEENRKINHIDFVLLDSELNEVATFTVFNVSLDNLHLQVIDNLLTGNAYFKYKYTTYTPAEREE